ncbi:hypothetical protein JFV29_12395 [Peribacillus sp. TH16]|uniref:hypothetical protein n=1 Tax=Peribacillus sp. TH16 TaxID=2798482 RepID=UPI001914A433|nr:hypothetical protein [Peribacillus sp. TH16]MBK5482682.1 hypothetical protein [Peribacillus sp. TH16]
MSVIDELEVLEGVFHNASFLLQGIDGKTMNSIYTLEEMRTFGLIVGESGRDYVFPYLLDEGASVYSITGEKLDRLRYEVGLVCDELERLQKERQEPEK